jgi:putative sporulation protein YyaC
MNISICEYKSMQYYNNLKSILEQKIYSEIVFCCVGNPKIWFDCFSSCVGKLLKANPQNKCFVYGGDNYPIVPDNLLEYMDFIETKHPSACIIVLDNCITLDCSQNYCIAINNSSLIPAGLINSRPFGHISIVLKTYIDCDCWEFLSGQTAAIKELMPALEKVIKIYKNV